jgi:hypothetical protein
MRKITALLLLAAVLSVSRNAHAQPDRCDAVLAATQHVSASEEDFFLEAVARLSDRKSLKESAERLKIGLYDVIDADGDGWRRAKERVRKNQSRFTTSAHARSYLFEGPASGAVEAWASCMRRSGGPAFFAYIPNGGGAKNVGVTLYWTKGSHDATPLSLHMPPHEVGVRQLTGEFTALFRRPSAAEGPREIVFNGTYPVANQDQVWATATIVLWPQEALEKPPIEAATTTRVEVDRITVNRSCDKEDEAKHAELRWVIFIGGEAFDGGKRINVADSERLSGVYVDYKGGTTGIIQVQVRMKEIDKGGDVGSLDNQTLAIDLGALNRSQPSRFELAMWPGPQRNECDVRVGVVVRPIM